MFEFRSIVVRPHQRVGRIVLGQKREKERKGRRLDSLKHVNLSTKYVVNYLRKISIKTSHCNGV